MFIYPSVGTWLVFTSWLLWIMLEWIWGDKELLKSLFQFFLAIYPEVELRDCMVILCLISLGITKLFTTAAFALILIFKNSTLEYYLSWLLKLSRTASTSFQVDDAQGFIPCTVLNGDTELFTRTTKDPLAGLLFSVLSLFGKRMLRVIFLFVRPSNTNLLPCDTGSRSLKEPPGLGCGLWQRDTLVIDGMQIVLSRQTLHLLALLILNFISSP